MAEPRVDDARSQESRDNVAMMASPTQLKEEEDEHGGMKHAELR